MIERRQPQSRVVKSPYEVFTLIEQTNSFHDRVKLLRDYETFAIKTILQCAFTPTINLDVPEGSPPFLRDVLPPKNSLGRIDKSIKILSRIALIGDQKPAVGIARIKNEKLFIQLLESVNENDADVIIAMKDKKLSKMYPSIDKTLVMTAFPQLF